MSTTTESDRLAAVHHYAKRLGFKPRRTWVLSQQLAKEANIHPSELELLLALLVRGKGIVSEAARLFQSLPNKLSPFPLGQKDELDLDADLAANEPSPASNILSAKRKSTSSPSTAMRSQLMSESTPHPHPHHQRGQSISGDSTGRIFFGESPTEISVMDALAPEEIETWKQEVMKRRTGRAALIKFVNNTAFPLYRAEMKTEPTDASSWGALPPSFVAPFTVAEFGTQTMRLGKGTYGTVSYTTRKNHSITLSWANPFVGKNSHTAKVSATLAEDAAMLVVESTDKKVNGSNLFEVDINVSLAADVDPSEVDGQNEKEVELQARRRKEEAGGESPRFIGEGRDSIVRTMSKPRPLSFDQDAQSADDENSCSSSLSASPSPSIEWMNEIQKAGRSVLVRIHNKTDLPLFLLTCEAEKGIWRKEPPACIPSHSEVEIGIESTGKGIFCSGARGTAVYVAFGHEEPLEFLWVNSILLEPKFVEVCPPAFLFEKTIEMSRTMPTVSYMISCQRVPLTPDHLYYQRLQKPTQALDSDDGGRSTILVHSDPTPYGPDNLRSSSSSFSSSSPSSSGYISNTPETSVLGSVSLSQFVITLPEEEEMKKSNEEKPPTAIDSVVEENESPSNCAPKKRERSITTLLSTLRLPQLTTNVIAIPRKKKGQSIEEIVNEFRQMPFSSFSSILSTQITSTSTSTEFQKQQEEEIKQKKAYFQKLKHSDANKVIWEVSRAIKQFSKQERQPPNGGEVIQIFFECLEKIMRSSKLWSSSTQDEIDFVIDCLHEYMMRKIFVFVFPSQKDMLREDLELHHKIKALGLFLQPKHLEIPEEYWDLNLWTPAILDLLKLNICRAPKDKMAVIFNCCKKIFKVLCKGGQNAGVDEFIPIMTYVVIKANPMFMLANVEYITDYTDQSKMMSEYGYCFSNFSVAVHFLKGLDSSSLKIEPPDDFDTMMNNAFAALPPFQFDLDRAVSSLQDMFEESEREENHYSLISYWLSGANAFAKSLLSTSPLSSTTSASTSPSYSDSCSTSTSPISILTKAIGIPRERSKSDPPALRYTTSKVVPVESSSYPSDSVPLQL
eukprot:TRINITY_DN4352_c0_g1_i1.p1 TRINITY_DN4352_c0_g1~~TRINITY_DN4352_c0_g1_i1.p1  ORF type:complete len:1072 (-),score=262.41 TRINITY_DN4352_c0_g1_i1:43-3258(-)